MVWWEWALVVPAGIYVAGVVLGVFGFVVFWPFILLADLANRRDDFANYPTQILGWPYYVVKDLLKGRQ